MIEKLEFKILYLKADGGPEDIASQVGCLHSITRN